MASVNYEKIKSVAEAKAMFRHCDKEMRIITEHSNKDINKDVTEMNTQSIRGYKEACARFDRRLKFIDSLPNANKRKDRVVLFGLDIPVPENLSFEEQNEWFYEVRAILKSFYGEENYIADYNHYDEVHTYIDPLTNKEVESRPHKHAYIIPFCTYSVKKKDGSKEEVSKLSGKEFSKKANIIAINNAIEKMTREKFGCKWQTGEKTKSTATVEELKKASLVAKQKELSRLNYEIAQKSVTNDLVSEIINKEQKYMYAVEDIKYLKSEPTVDGIEYICSYWNCPEYKISDTADMNVFWQKVNELIEYLVSFLEWLASLFYDILGKPYERVVEETREQIKEDFEKEFE